jgi:ribonuclease R
MNKETLKTSLLEILKNDNIALLPEEIKDKLNLKQEDYKLLFELLIELEKEMRITITKKGKYKKYDNPNLRVGVIEVKKKGYGFVDIEGHEEDVFVANKNLKGAINGDKVVVEITSKTGIDLEGKIIQIVERKENHVGEFYEKNGKYYVDLDDEKMLFDIAISKDQTLGAVTGHKVIVKLGKKINDRLYEGTVSSIIGHKNTPGVDIKSILPNYDIVEDFAKETLDEVTLIPREVLQAELTGRRDLRGEEIFTIDGNDTKDIDDAISLKVLPNGNYILGVHIADVTNYVKEGMSLEKDSYSRGTSHYLADKVVPMLPPELSNGICSLNPNVDRLALSVDIEIDPKGKIVGYDFYESVINSNIQMTYDSVNEILQGKSIPEGYEKHANTLIKMLEVSRLLRNTRYEKGGIEFETKEAKIIVDKDGKAIDIKLRERYEAEKLIEDFMIAANECAAHFCTLREMPTLYRVHDLPKEEKLKDFLKLVSLLGHNVTGKIKHQIHPKIIQQLTVELQKFDDYPILSKFLLRAMAKAKYSPKAIGHFGLALEDYLHFTSPIRRMPDQFAHRAIKDIINGKIYSDRELDALAAKMLVAGEYLSKVEIKADGCEREVESMKKAEYMENHIGEIHEGTIVDIKSFGMFVELENTVDGLIKIEELNSLSNKFNFIEDALMFKSDNGHTIYRIGQKVKVEVLRASKEERKIDFAIAKELDLEENHVKKTGDL